MSPDQASLPDDVDPRVTGSGAEPVITNANEDTTEFVQAAGEDEADIAVGAASRALDEEQLESTEPVPAVRGAEEEPASDSVAAALATTPPTYAAQADISVLKEYEREVHDVILELKRIEAEVRALLEDRDPKRKRKLSGTHRWQELEDDILSWRFTGRFDENTLRRAQDLIARRHYLFRHLRFLAGTRPVWNS